MVRVQSKFRCLGINHRWDGNHTVDLAPVMKSEEHPENAVWWEYTPSGEIEVLTGPECMFEVGAFYLVDMERLDEPPEDDYERKLCYHLHCVSDCGDQIEVKMESGYAARETMEGRIRKRVTADGIRRGKFSAVISNQKAWPAFVGHVRSYWRVVYSFAGPDDGTL